MPIQDTDWWSEERAARRRGHQLIAGIDEAGRGPLAGPVVAAAVVLPYETCPAGVRDSKTLSPRQRERAFAAIQDCALSIGLGIGTVEAIDQINILRANHQAMRDALLNLSPVPDVALIDGLPVQPFPIPQIAIVKGDSRSASIAAASIIAKVTRDRMMEEMDGLYPGYGFASHKGYATPEHLLALSSLGPSPIHRRFFAPVSQATLDLGTDAPELPTGTEKDGRRELGESGELVAAAHLRSLGWVVIETRYHCRGGELDIIAHDGEALVFAEVKTRSHGAFGLPAAAVDKRKRARMAYAAAAYLNEKRTSECVCRFDVVEVIFAREGNASVNVLRSAFMAGE